MAQDVFIGITDFFFHLSYHWNNWAKEGMIWQVHSLSLTQLQKGFNVLWNSYLILRLVRWPRPRCGLVCSFYSCWIIAIKDAAFSWLHKISKLIFKNTSFNHMSGSRLVHFITDEIEKRFLINHTLH